MIQREVKEFVVEGGRVVGIRTNFDEIIRAGAVILTAGTFMRSSIGLAGLPGYRQAG